MNLVLLIKHVPVSTKRLVIKGFFVCQMLLCNSVPNKCIISQY